MHILQRIDNLRKTHKTLCVSVLRSDYDYEIYKVVLYGSKYSCGAKMDTWRKIQLASGAIHEKFAAVEYANILARKFGILYIKDVKHGKPCIIP